MSLYEARLQADIDAIRGRVDRLALDVKAAVSATVDALFSGDRVASYQVVLDDKPINRESRAIDALCHSFVARHHPAAGHLRLVSSVLRLDVELERIGDYAVNVALSSVRLSTPPKGPVEEGLRDLAGRSQAMLGDALDAWTSGNAEKARTTRHVAYEIEAVHEQLEQSIAAQRAELAPADLMALVDIAHNLERVAAQSKNICEETVFAVTGQTKPPKVYKLLFVDEANSCHSQLAEAFSRKAFPTSGDYASAGRAPAAQLDAGMLELGAQVGLDFGGAMPRNLVEELGGLRRYQVVINLGTAETSAALGPLPYKTVLLHWPVSPGELADQFREISASVRQLMETLRGEDAD